jgi:hypothetical protein
MDAGPVKSTAFLFFEKFNGLKMLDTGCWGSDFRCHLKKASEPKIKSSPHILIWEANIK